MDSPPAPLGPSRSTVYRLAALFSVDAFGGGLVINALLALWLSERFGISVSTIGAIFFVTSLCSAVSYFAAVPLARRFGLINTMVFTHLPSNLFLILTAFAPTIWMAFGLLILRGLLSQMDVPTRSSYVMAVVQPEERPAAASVTAVPIHQADRERSEGSEEGSDEAVVGEHGCALLVRHNVGNHRVFERQEQAHVAAGRIERSHKSNQQQRPETFDAGKSYTSHRHQESRSQQGATPRDPVGHQPNHERQQGGSQQGRARNGSDSEGIVAETGEMERQQKRDIPIAERPQRSRPENPTDVRRKIVVSADPGTCLGTSLSVLSGAC